MQKCVRGLSIFVLGIAVFSLIGCTTCGTPYRRELTNNSKLAEADVSYRKAIDLLDKAECSATPAEAAELYATAESYVSDAIFNLKKLGHDNKIDVTEDVYYCERIKTETDVKIGAAGRDK